MQPPRGPSVVSASFAASAVRWSPGLLRQAPRLGPSATPAKEHLTLIMWRAVHEYRFARVVILLIDAVSHTVYAVGVET